MNNRLDAPASTQPAHTTANVVQAVVGAVADAEGVSTLELPPLAEVLDPDALKGLCRDDGTDVTVEFSYHGYRVRVAGDGAVTLRDDNG